MIIKPITPEELDDIIPIPDFVIEAINNLIKKNYRGSSFTIKLQEIVQAIIANSRGSITQDKIYAEKWLDFEYIYRKNGWNVIYDKPGYDETYDAFFKFSKQK